MLGPEEFLIPSKVILVAGVHFYLEEIELGLKVIQLKEMLLIFLTR